jgi:predicted Zn-dependent protease
MLISALTLWLLAAKPPPDARQDVLDALVLELERSQQRLKLKENASPYFISYQLKDFHSRQLEARYGALFGDRDEHDRKVAVDLRVGSYSFDSAVDDEYDFSMSMKGNSYVAHKNGPIEDDPRALRTTLWLVTDEKYKLALFNFLKRKGEEVYAVEDPKRPPAFTQEKPVVHLGERLPDQFDRPRWAALSKAISAQLAAVPELFDSEVRITGDHVQRYFVSTEGTRIVTEQTLFGVHLSAFTRAADGQLLDNSRDWYAPSEAQLPTDAAITAAAKTMVDELLALRAAPAIDPYTGPALLEPDAAGVLFHEAVGHRLEGERQNSEQEGKTFRGQVGKAVLPAFLTIVDDPTRAQVGGTPLNGAYPFDEQGVPAQKVTLIENGVLRAYLLSRKPVEGFAQSNGHGRSQGNRRPVARMANLIVESKKTLSDAQLKALLIAEAKKQGKPYGLIIRDITGGNTNTTSFGYQAFKGVPRLVYRVEVTTGKESLVRGVEIVGTPLSSVNRVLATGTTAGVFNGYCGAESGMVPVSTVAPATLLQEIELQRAGEGKDRPPLLPSPFREPAP